MKTRTQRLVAECRRAPALFRRHTAARVLQSLGVKDPHWALDRIGPGTVVTVEGLRFKHVAGSGDWDYWEVRAAQVMGVR